MEEKKAYCPACGRAVGFSTRRKRFCTELDGLRYAYEANQAYCSACGAEAVYPPYQESAGIAFNEAVRAGLGIVAYDVIASIPERYNIGKRPLSKVLGWGEHTYSQLLNGQVPNREHSRLIASIKDDPLVYRNLLLQNRDRIGERAFERSLAATDAYIRGTQPDALRLYELSRFFIELSHSDITAMAIQKLVYYAQGFSCCFFDGFIVDQMPRAWAAGPVYGQLWHRYKHDDEGYFRCEGHGEFSTVFTPREDALIRAIYRFFGCYSGDALSRMTRRELPWLAARKRAGALPGERCEEQLSEADMLAFFQGVARDYGIGDYGDIEAYAVAAFGHPGRKAF